MGGRVPLLCPLVVMANRGRISKTGPSPGFHQRVLLFFLHSGRIDPETLFFHISNHMVTNHTSLDLVFAALADPTRRAILSHLATDDATVGELAAPFEMSWPAVTKHLKNLERAGLIER